MAAITDLNEYKKQTKEAEQVERDFVASYQELRDLMVSLFGPLDHIPEEPASEAYN